MGQCCFHTVTPRPQTSASLQLHRVRVHATADSHSCDLPSFSPAMVLLLPAYLVPRIHVVFHNPFPFPRSACSVTTVFAWSLKNAQKFSFMLPALSAGAQLQQKLQQLPQAGSSREASSCSWPLSSPTKSPVLGAGVNGSVLWKRSVVSLIRRMQNKTQLTPFPTGMSFSVLWGWLCSDPQG